MHARDFGRSLTSGMLDATGSVVLDVHCFALHVFDTGVSYAWKAQQCCSVTSPLDVHDIGVAYKGLKAVFKPITLSVLDTGVSDGCFLCM